jgi:hypothetical protein
MKKLLVFLSMCLVSKMVFSIVIPPNHLPCGPPQCSSSVNKEVKSINSDNAKDEVREYLYRHGK